MNVDFHDKSSVNTKAHYAKLADVVYWDHIWVR